MAAAGGHLGKRDAAGGAVSLSGAAGRAVACCGSRAWRVDGYRPRGQGSAQQVGGRGAPLGACERNPRPRPRPRPRPGTGHRALVGWTAHGASAGQGLPRVGASESRPGRGGGKVEKRGRQAAADVCVWGGGRREAGGGTAGRREPFLHPCIHHPCIQTVPRGRGMGARRVLCVCGCASTLTGTRSGPYLCPFLLGIMRLSVQTDGYAQHCIYTNSPWPRHPRCAGTYEMHAPNACIYTNTHQPNSCGQAASRRPAATGPPSHLVLLPTNMMHTHTSARPPTCPF